MTFRLKLTILLLFTSIQIFAQENDMLKAAQQLLKLLTPQQKEKIIYPYNNEERYAWYYVPKDDRKGLKLSEMNTAQRNAAAVLMKTALSKNGYTKATAIISLEKILKAVEQRKEDDHYRDTGKYFITIFNEPSSENTWGWRIDGHHLSLSFSAASGKLVAVTPGFFGANPAVVLSGPQKGQEILKDETQLGLELINALDEKQKQQAIYNKEAPADILTTNQRKAMLESNEGIAYHDLNPAQQKIFMQLLSVYIQRYTHLFATKMMHEIEQAGFDKLVFAWAGSTENGVGHPKYYRIKSNTLIIEYDNTQNNGNHVHTVIRDLKNDFGGDALIQHYEAEHTQK